MCGIAGWVDFDRNVAEQLATVEAMADTMACRGPDEAGSWAAGPVALGHRRLAVIDLQGGRQPMVAEEDDRARAVITVQWRVYNFAELRSRLEA